MKIEEIQKTFISTHVSLSHEHSLQLDSLRGFSALVVLFAHANQVFVTPQYQGMYWFLGLLAQAAVMMFFSLSGFLIFRSITKNRQENGFFNVKKYFFDRAFRIYPPLLFSLILVVVLCFLAPYFLNLEVMNFLITMN